MEKDKYKEAIMDWCHCILGEFEVVSDTSREHPGQRASSFRLHTPAGRFYVKLHRDLSHWENEVHAYQNWAPAFGELAPRLVAVRSEEPLALIITELPGKITEEMHFSTIQEQNIWYSSGRALASLHHLQQGNLFGPCHPDGSPTGEPFSDARLYMAHIFDDLEERGVRGGFLTENELAIVCSARSFIPAFKDERPFPCHRDYCPANWLATDNGVLTGVIDFEFSYWDTRTADFARMPNWQWVDRLDLTTAFFTGYNLVLTDLFKQQLLVSYAQYALGAIVWGKENAYHIFAEEGRRALKFMSTLL